MKELFIALVLAAVGWSTTASAETANVKWTAIETVEIGKVGCGRGRTARWDIVVEDGIMTASRDDNYLHFRRVPMTALADDGSGKVEFTSKRGEHIEFWFDRGVGSRNIRVFTVWNNCVLLFEPLKHRPSQTYPSIYASKWDYYRNYRPPGPDRNP
jgi:hypothetical protein